MPTGLAAHRLRLDLDLERPPPEAGDAGAETVLRAELPREAGEAGWRARLSVRLSDRRGRPVKRSVTPDLLDL